LDEIKKTVSLINDLIVGTPIDEVSSKLEFEIKPIIGRYVKEHEMVYNTFYQVFKDFSSKNVNVVGKNNILKQPEFNNIEKIQDIFGKLDNKEEIIDNITEENNDINIYIGKENKLDEEVTVIKTKYHTKDQEGTIAIVGPKRMDYDRVVTLLEYIKENIEK
jgi:heat-inducible transcriptional repressor